MSSDQPGPSGSQEACFSDVMNEGIYDAYCTLLEKVKGEDRKISVKEVLRICQKSLIVLQRAVPIPQPYTTKFQVYIRVYQV